MAIDNINILNRSHVIDVNIDFEYLTSRENHIKSILVNSSYVFSNSRILCSMLNIDEDALIQNISIGVSNIQNGSFTLFAYAPDGYSGILSIQCLIL